MLYRLIKEKRDRWIASGHCTVKPLIEYMEQTGKMRDAQIDAIKTYLFLKISCENKPLWELMYNGRFNLLSEDDIDNLALKSKAHQYLKTHAEALALYEYASAIDDNGVVTSPKLAELIGKAPESIDYESIIKRLFYNVSYADYLFSIPMGAGKTWLMAAFIYLNLYLALNEPDNKLFAHNFIILAPAGLKSSIIPSLIDIQEFDPAFILPEPIASQLKSKLKFEFLDEAKSAKDSNLVKNPNAQKISVHQPFSSLEGLVIVTNAEKLYDRIGKTADTLPTVFDALPDAQRKEWLKTVQANELRQIIARVPNLCIMVDEVHHASEEQLLRKVIEKWVSQKTFNSVLGFSGTPYLSTPEKIEISDELKIKNSMLSNVVTYYPLVNAVGNFLKIPVIKSSDVSSQDIVRNGLVEFFNRYADKSYPGVGWTKIAIYCGRIDTLENEIYPLVYKMCHDYGLNPDDAILKYYRSGSKSGFTCPADSEARFRSLDTELSPVRIVLLVQIGKEGWNCKSLTGVILPNENSSPRNMVLQTSCRCLREVVDARDEHALIWLNSYNERILDEQLRKEQHTTVEEIQKTARNVACVRRYSRQSIVQLPAIDYIQLKFSYKTIKDDTAPAEKRLAEILICKKEKALIFEKDLKGNSTIAGQSELSGRGVPMEYRHWLNLIVKESFNALSLSELVRHGAILEKLFNSASVVVNGVRVLDPAINQSRLRADIRKCFSSKESICFTKETIPAEASLLKVERLAEPYYPSADRIIYPSVAEVHDIVAADNPTPIPHEIQAAIDSLKDNPTAAEALLKLYAPKAKVEKNDRTYQYIPYTFDSGFEQDYYQHILRAALDIDTKVEGYFSGDESLSQFYIDCYKYDGRFWRSIGRYYPDFVLLKRDDTGRISKVVIIETKGTVYEAAFADKKAFMEQHFVDVNNECGPTKFSFLYLPESYDKDKLYALTKERVELFLKD